MSEGAEAASERGGVQVIPRPALVRAGPPAPWTRESRPESPHTTEPPRITLSIVREALAWRGEPGGRAVEVVTPEEGAAEQNVVPVLAGRPAAVLCALFDEEAQAHVVLTRRSSRLRSHTGQVSFPGGRLDPGEAALACALREAREEVGLDPSTVDVFARLSTVRIMANPAPVLPFVGGLPSRPLLHPNPAEVERAFTVPLSELADPDVYREEIWTFPDGTERRMHFFELIGDTVWGATARMLYELLDTVLATAQAP